VTAAAPYLLDTTVLVDVSREREPAANWTRSLLRGASVVGVSTVSVAEFFAGLPPAERSAWETFLGDLERWEVTTEIAVRAGSLRYDYSRRGRTILIPDAIIAATAIAVGAVLVTSNVKHFSIPELVLIEPGGRDRS
jgi:predicted nucleic acid-binding protein